MSSPTLQRALSLQTPDERPKRSNNRLGRLIGWNFWIGGYAILGDTKRPLVARHEVDRLRRLGYLRELENGTAGYLPLLPFRLIGHIVPLLTGLIFLLPPARL